MQNPLVYQAGIPCACIRVQIRSQLQITLALDHTLVKLLTCYSKVLGNRIILLHAGDEFIHVFIC